MSSTTDYQHPGAEEFTQAHARLVGSREARNRLEEAPDQVYAMQMVIHLPRGEAAPARSEVLAAAAQACLCVCYDARAALPTSTWATGLEGWYTRRIRKVTRRARGAHWDKAHTVAGVTYTRDSGAAVRAFVPGLVSAVPQAISRLQIKGTDLAYDEPAPAAEDVPLILVDKGLGMSAGKAAAQAAHAGMLYAATLTPDQAAAFAATGFALNAREVDSDTFQSFAARADAVPVVDAGYTEVAPGSTTALCLPPRTTTQ